jgi:nitrate reductase gamma subunit
MNATFVFTWWPYVAMALFIAGLAVRYGCTRGAKLPRARALFVGAGWLRLSLVLLFLGHLAGLLFPRQIILWNGMPARLYLLEGFAFAVGVGSLVGWASVMWRHFGRSGGSVASQLADVVFLSGSFVALLSGLLTAVFYRWGSSWSAATLTPYAWSLLRGNPVAALAAQLPFLVRLHVFSSLAILAMIPLTRLAPLLMVPLHHGLDFLVGGFSALVRPVRSTLELVFERNNPLPRIWPEED